MLGSLSVIRVKIQAAIIPCAGVGVNMSLCRPNLKRPGLDNSLCNDFECDTVNQSPNSPFFNRRSWLKAVASFGAGAALSGCSHPKSKLASDRHRHSGEPSELILRENQYAGSQDWLLTNTRIEPGSKYRCPWIEGYCSRRSVRAGEALDIYVSTNPASEFMLEIFRM